MLRIWKASQHEDYMQWLAAWKDWPRREVFAHPDYLRLFEREKCEGLCAAWLDANGVAVMFPFLLRDLAAEPYYSPALGPAADIASPYGYGGAFCCSRRDRDDVSKKFWDAFTEWGKSRSVVSEFIRFSLFEEDLLDHAGEVQAKQRNIVRSLDLAEEELWRDVDHKVRKNVMKAKRCGVCVVVDDSGSEIEEFLRIYEGTMARRLASSRYYFSKQFFQSIHRQLPGQFIYFHAVHQERIISTELVLVSANSVYSFLGGTEEQAFHLRPNDLLKYEIILWAKHHEKESYVLGGGFEPDDGIFRYKLAFAPNGCVPFRVGHRVLQPFLYDELLNRRQEWSRATGLEWSPPPGFFPAYRG